MKKVINGKLYDTDTAKRVGSWDNGCSTNDFDYCSEDLYRKKTGEFFLHGEGHAMSRYASSSGDGRGWGEAIIPLTFQKAQKWAEDHLNGDEYIALFGAPEEDDNKTAIHAYIPKASLAKLKDEQAKTGKSIGDIIDTLIKGEN